MARASFEHLRQVGLDLAQAATGKQADPCSARIEAVFLGELLSRNCRLRQIRQRMPNKLGIDSARAVPRLLERKNNQHAAHIFAHQLDAVLLPRP